MKQTYNVPKYMTVFLSNISDMFDVSFDKSYSVVKNVTEVYMLKRNILLSSSYVSVSLQHCVSVCTYIAWFGMVITKYMLCMYVSVHSMVK